jgi:hypothetical protein
MRSAPRAWALRCVLCLCANAALGAKGAPAGATLLAAGTPSSSDVPPPNFCHGLQCPEYATLATTKDYELRRYSPSRWVSTVVTGANYDAAVNQVCRSLPRVRPRARGALTLQRAQGFNRLFAYIGGANADGSKIPMTAPVTVDVAPGAGPTCGSNFTVSFYLSESAPAPSSAQVFFTQLPVRDVYVASFGGWANQQKVIAKAAALSQALAEAGMSVDAQDEGFTVAQYDSPFRLADRHNEIWLLAPAPPDMP